MLKKFVLVGGATLLLAGLLITTLLVAQPTLSLGFLTGPVSSLLSSVTGKSIELKGQCMLTPGLWTKVRVESLSAVISDNIKRKRLMRMDAGSVGIHLASLLRGDVKLSNLQVSGSQIDFGYIEKGKEQGKTTISEVIDPSGDIMEVLPEITSFDLADVTIISDNKDGKQQIITLQSLAGSLSKSTGFKITGNGLIDDRLVAADLHAYPTDEETDTGTVWNISAQFCHRLSLLSLSGAFSIQKKRIKGDLSFSADGDSIDDIVSWFGLAGTDCPYRLTGNLELAGPAVTLRVTEAVPIASNLHLQFSVPDFRSMEGISVRLAADEIDLDELERLVFSNGRQKQGTRSASASSPLSIEDLLFTGTFPLDAIDFEIDIKTLILAEQTLKGLKLESSMKDRRVVEAPFQVIFEHSALTGHHSLDISTPIPELFFLLETRSLDIGAILAKYKLAHGIDLKMANVSTMIGTKGRSIREFLTNLSVEIHCTDGSFRIMDPNTGAVLEIAIDSSTITAVPGEAITQEISGTIGKTPIELMMHIDDLRGRPVAEQAKAPFSLCMLAANAKLDLSGSIPIPFTWDGLILNSSFATDRLSSLEELLGIDLPDIGPCTLRALLAVNKEGYALKDLALSVGQSSLAGEVEIKTVANPPYLGINLVAGRLQLDDFKELSKKETRPEDQGQDQQEDRRTGDEASEERVFLTDQQILDRYDAWVHLAVKEMRSGDDVLGSGRVTILQKDGHLQIGPLEVDGPGGSIAFSLALGPSAGARSYRLNLEIDNFDYGIIGRRLKSDSDMRGVVNLRASLESESSHYKNIMCNASGYLNFSVEPEKLSSGIIDLWAVNLLTHLLPLLTPKNESKVNCLAGRFTMADGVMKQEDLLIDTSRIQVKGTVEIDFKNDRIDAYLRPIPKRPQFFSLAAPIVINGHLTDFSVGVAPGGLVGTVIRFMTSYIVVPLKWILLKPVPADGTEHCLQMLRVSEERKDQD